MAIIKCKMCGGDLNLIEGQTVAECEFCGSRQTVPSADNEKKMNMFGSANKLRAACEFDRAMGVYDSIRAEFPDEAEAYWGLVLCKYGIEYVDDPATGKKVPTCHRSSYDSIMEDSDFEQTLDNADSAARKLYLEEAKRLEQIRKDILAVSSKEAPYDVFICYKETDENGDRTLDSEMAQQIYMALTDRGYRVFFARVTLKGALGAAYEPIIFAALHSAKVMLAIGTCYEYFNAVWVKNEWSRYLKIVAQDNNKYLIPCFRDIEIHDMPREFRPLQAVDLGQMGAVQDIVLNMEKYIPRKISNTTVIQEKVVVGGSGNNKIASLLDRGNMALEDGDWAKADSFFEDVLNNDSKNAQAYLGKTLAMEKCRTIDAFARKRKDVSQNVRGETLHLEPDYAHVSEMTERFRLSGYVEGHEIKNLYSFDLSYHSDVAERRQQYRNEESYWANHKWLSRAEKFAVGAVAENLAAEKKALLSVLAERLKKAETAEAAAKKDVQTRYEAHLCQADEQAEALYNEGLNRRETWYQDLLKRAKTSSDVRELTQTAEKFEKLGDYQDSKNLAEHCRKRAAEEQVKLDAEKERQRRIREQQEKEQKKKNRTKAIISAVVAAVVIAVIVVMTTVVMPARNYAKAEAMLAAGDYDKAFVAFQKLGDYQDSPEKSEMARKEHSYRKGLEYMAAGEYDFALDAFANADDPGYKDIAQKIQEIQTIQENQELEKAYQQAAEKLTAGDYDAARKMFEELGDYSDSARMITECTYQEAISMLAYGFEVDYDQIAEARELLISLGDYSDAAAYVDQFRYVCIRYKDSENNYYYWYDDHGRQVGYAAFSDVYQYNEAGQLVYSAGYAYEYNELGQKIRATVKQNSYIQVAEYGYNDNGDLAWSQITNDFTDEKLNDSTHSWKYEYEYENGLIKKKEAYLDGKLNSTTEYTYNASGWLLDELHISPYGSKSSTYYTYDENGYLIKSNGKEYTNGYIWAPKAETTR